ncbi:ParB/RepB/Spo0J family partition protein [Vibrio sp. 10N.261.51.E5]|uniref:ParB/RepB/Spo0J family partition protein n=1 Tax=Vibrio sp. 10N.261.51.E5 TaxID=3229677 RepID=UPI00354D6170
MKSDVQVEVQPSSVSVQEAGKRNKKKLQKLESQAAAGSTMTHKVMGKEVKFKLVEVPADKIELSTMVYLGNERNQFLLDAHAVSDLIETFKDQGQQVPAFGRDVCGQIEIADGSRRRFTALETKKPFYVWVGDLDEQQMQFLSDVGNKYKDTSAWEKGLRYERMLNNATQEEVAEAVGVSRKAMMRCVNTAQLPKAFIRSFTSPNELSARKGEALYKVYKTLTEEKQEEIVNFCDSWLIPEKGKHATEEIIDLFITKCGATNDKPEAVKPRELAMGATVALKNGNATINIPKISDDSLKAIEDFISQTLSKEALDNC